jgi:filamentous hemagglutinin family protein
LNLWRVTGGEASLVDGTIRSTIGGASFWFVNPAGITIGPSGAIDVSGAVALGAADSIAFEDGASFFALPDDGRIALDQATLRTDSTGVKSAGDIGLVADTVRVNGGQLTTSVTKLRFGNEPGSFDYSAGIFVSSSVGSIEVTVRRSTPRSCRAGRPRVSIRSSGFPKPRSRFQPGSVSAGCLAR